MRDGRLQPNWTLLLVAAALLWPAGCGPSRQAGATAPLLPPVPLPPADLLAAPPPALSAPLYVHEEPEIVRGTEPRLAQPSELAVVLDRVNRRFEAGKRFYRAGLMDAARQEFDRAIETLLASTATGADRAALERRLVELADAIHQYDVSGLGGGSPEDEPVFEKSPLEEIPEPTFPIDPKLRNQVAEELKTTVSQLPLEVTDEVLRYINYFTTERGKRTILYGLQRAGRYRPMIQRILDEEGMPQELIHLAQAESGFAPRAVSRKKAAGMWQFIPSRGNEYGLRQTKTVDERLDPEKATRAAARHLKDLYNEFGDWYLAMAAYNCGPLNVEKAVARTGYADFWELRRRNVLPKETANYVPIILAMVIISKNPEHYGFSSAESEPPVEYSTITLDADTSLDLIGDIVERPVAELRAMNPALLTNVAPAGYSLHVPAGSSASVLAALSAVPPAQRTTWRLHRVVEGDSLATIAARYRTSVQQVAEVNAAWGGNLEPGSVLLVPAAPPPAKTAARKTSSRGRVALRRTALSSRAKPTTPKRASSSHSGTTSKAPAAAARTTSAPKSSGRLPASSKPTLTASQKRPTPPTSSASAAR